MSESKIKEEAQNRIKEIQNQYAGVGQMAKTLFETTQHACEYRMNAEVYKVSGDEELAETSIEVADTLDKFNDVLKKKLS